MSSLDIKINIDELLDYSASLKFNESEKTIITMIESFSKYVLEFYGRLLENSIYSNRYKGEWEPTNDPGYLEYIGTIPSRSILILIREALEVVRKGRNFVIRINPKVRYPGSKLKLAIVIRAIDVGTSDFNARPIFYNITKEINRHLKELWGAYLELKGVI